MILKIFDEIFVRAAGRALPPAHTARAAQPAAEHCPRAFPRALPPHARRGVPEPPRRDKTAAATLGERQRQPPASGRLPKPFYTTMFRYSAFCPFSLKRERLSPPAPSASIYAGKATP